MGATVPAPPLLRRPQIASLSQAPGVSEAKPVFVVPPQEVTSLAALAAEPTPAPTLPPSAPAPTRGNAIARQRFRGGRFGRYRPVE